VFDEWQLRIEKCLKSAKKMGQISNKVNCKEAAYLFWIGWEGAVLRAKLERDPSALKVFSKFFISSLG
jgi:TetR/AcrR family transcriptional repressor of nem operon